MKEKNSIKISLGTAICIFIIVVLLLALGGMYYYFTYVKQGNNNQDILEENSLEVQENNTNNEQEKNIYDNLGIWYIDGDDEYSGQYARELTIKSIIANEKVVFDFVVLRVGVFEDIVGDLKENTVSFSDDITGTLKFENDKIVMKLIKEEGKDVLPIEEKAFSEGLTFNMKKKISEQNYEDYQLDEIEYLYVTNVVDNGETYTLQGKIYRRYIIEEEELQRLKKGKTLIIGGTEYKYSESISSIGENSEIVERGLVAVDRDDEEIFYDIVEFGENTYTILSRATIMDVIQLTGEKKEVTVAKEKIVILEPDSSTVGEYFKNYECKEEPTEYYPNSKYMYSFEYDENGGCETVINVVTSM